MLKKDNKAVYVTLPNMIVEWLLERAKKDILDKSLSKQIAKIVIEKYESENKPI